MSKNFVVSCTILSGLILISCTPEPDKPAMNGDNESSISSVSSSSTLPASSSSAAISVSTPRASAAPFTRKTYYDASTGFTFWHPARLTVIAPKSFYLEEGEVGYEITSPTIDEGFGVFSVLENISVGLKPDAREKSNGPVTGQDVYSPPGGNLSRHYVLYTGKYRVTVYANYDVFPAFYKGKYEPSDGFSITDLVKRDLGGDLNNPIQRLIAVYPSEKTLKQFYQDSDAIVKSMETE
ncbi:MAG: hypothetical protein AAB544_02055 [Patescibacteria group bacterium]